MRTSIKRREMVLSVKDTADWQDRGETGFRTRRQARDFAMSLAERVEIVTIIGQLDWSPEPIVLDQVRADISDRWRK